MRIVNPTNAETPFYAGVCKNNTAPKHLTRDDVATKKIKLDEADAIMYNSPKSSQYIYIQVGSNNLWVKDKSIFELPNKKFTTTKIERKKAEGEESSDEATA